MQQALSFPGSEGIPSSQASNELRSALNKLRDQYGLSFADIAKATGISRPQLSRFASGQIQITQEREEIVAAFVADYEASGKLKAVEEPVLAPVRAHNGILYETQEFKLALGWCEYIRTERKMGTLIGHPGVGKSTVIQHYAATTPGVLLFEAWPSMRTGDFISALARLLGLALRGNVYERSQHIMRHLLERDDVTIIIDEGEYLRSWDVSKFEILRKLWDNTGTPIIIAGTPELESILTRGTGSQNLAQLYRRKMELKLKGIKKPEAREILDRHQVDPDAAELLIKIALDVTHGGMGNFCEILQMCVRSAQGQRITMSVLEGAMRFKLMY